MKSIDNNLNYKCCYLFQVKETFFLGVIMKDNIWIINHYAGEQFIQKGGRHFWFAKYLSKAGYKCTVFCCNAEHGTGNTIVDLNGLWEKELEEENKVPWVFVKGRTYKNNGKNRILNMIDFYFNVKKAGAEYSLLYGKPSIILASSVHPLTLVAGIQMAKRYSIKCISEVRDLWPASIVAYSKKLTNDSLIIKLLYFGEKWIYKHSDAIIMTWPGGYDYIRDMGWQNSVPENKVIHIPNGLDLDQFYANSLISDDKDDTDAQCTAKKFIYVGSIRKVNNIGMLLDAAKILKERKVDNVEIVIYGAGDELEYLEEIKRCNNLDNVCFKGKVPKSCIPTIIKNAYCNILHNSSTFLNKYGQSQNKFFEYLAAGRPILMTYSVGHSIIRQFKCGVELDNQTPQAIASEIERMSMLSAEEYSQYCKNALETAKKYDFRKLTNTLINLIESI